MRRGLIVLIAATAALVPAAQAQADACVSNADGNWSAPGTWTDCGGGIPTSGDSAAIVSPPRHQRRRGADGQPPEPRERRVIQFTAATRPHLTGTFATSGGVISGNGTVTSPAQFTQSEHLHAHHPGGRGPRAQRGVDDRGAQIVTSDQGGGDPSLQVNSTLTMLDGTGAGTTAIGTFAGGDVPT